MACLAKISSAIEYDCSNGFVGFAKVAAVNREDIESFSIVDGEVKTISFAASTVYIGVASQKKSFSVSESTRVNDNAPNAYVHEVTVTVFEKENPKLFNELVNGKLVFFTNYRNYYRVFGLYYGLSVTASAMNSSENGGWATFTLTTPEAVLGEDYLTVEATVASQVFTGANI